MNPRLVRGLLAASAVAAVVAAGVAASGGGSLELGAVTIRSHDPIRPAILAICLLAGALAAGAPAVREALGWWGDVIDRHAAAGAVGAALLAAAAGIVWGTFVAGGSDSYCYLNQAELFTRGVVRDHEPFAADPGWPGNVWSFAPAGHIPARDEPGYYVPICPAGYPLLLAAAKSLFGRTAMFWVTPLMGGLAVFFAFVLARRAAGPSAGLLAALLTASSPIVLYQIVQPMNDIPAASAWTAALVIASSTNRSDTARAMLAGAVSGFALTMRPNLVPLAGIVAIGAALLPPQGAWLDRLRSLVLFSLAALPGILIVMAVQWAMYGSPLSSGYGDLSALFSSSNILPNLRRYPAWMIAVHTPLVLAALAAPFVLRPERRRVAGWLLAFAASAFIVYLPYVVFDAWWYLRFLLPAVPMLLALAAAAVVALLARLPRHVSAVVFAAICIALPLTYLRIAVARDAFLLGQHEWRFRSAGEYVATLPATAMVITNHHSGSARFYSGRRTAGWSDIEPGRLDAAIRFFEEKGLKPYLLLENWEEPDFTRRFPNDRLGKLDWPPAAEIDDRVRIYDPADYARHRQGERIQTARVATRNR